MKNIIYLDFGEGSSVIQDFDHFIRYIVLSGSHFFSGQANAVVMFPSAEDSLIYFAFPRVRMPVKDYMEGNNQ